MPRRSRQPDDQADVERDAPASPAPDEKKKSPEMERADTANGESPQPE